MGRFDPPQSLPPPSRHRRPASRSRRPRSRKRAHGGHPGLAHRRRQPPRNLRPQAPRRLRLRRAVPPHRHLGSRCADLRTAPRSRPPSPSLHPPAVPHPHRLLPSAGSPAAAHRAPCPRTPQQARSSRSLLHRPQAAPRFPPRVAQLRRLEPRPLHRGRLSWARLRTIRRHGQSR